MTSSSIAGPDLKVHPDPDPKLLIELGPEGKGVGSWVPEQKHKLVCEYLHATRHAWKKWPNRVLIDPFCGPGRIQVRGERETREGGAVLAWRTLSAHAPFTSVYVGDIDVERVRACEARLKCLGALARAFEGSARDTIHEMVDAVPRNALCFAYIDPYNLSYLSFSIFQALASLKVDLAVNFSTMDLQRNVDFESSSDRDRFDDVAPGWRDSPEIKSSNRSGMALAFFNYWRNLVATLHFEHSQEMPLITNDTGHGIYRMMFFARNPLPKRIWSDVARGPNRDLFDQ